MIAQRLLLAALTLLFSAFVAAEPAPQQPGAMFNFLMLGGFVVLFYFLLWRPQSKRAKEHRNLMASLGKGDEAVTNGGLIGKIVKVTDEFVVLQIADNVEIKVQKPSITALLPKGTIKEIEKQ